MSSTFGCAINCLDGRAQLPAIEWIKFNGNVQYVDIVTAPGMDGLISKNESTDIEKIYQNVMASVRLHGVSIIALVGHHDCLGNPVSMEQHLEDIESAAKNVVSWVRGIRVVGLYVNEFSAVDVIYDTAKEDFQIRSFL